VIVAEQYGLSERNERRTRSWTWCGANPNPLRLPSRLCTRPRRRVVSRSFSSFFCTRVIYCRFKLVSSHCTSRAKAWEAVALPIAVEVDKLGPWRITPRHRHRSPPGANACNTASLVLPCNLLVSRSDGTRTAEIGVCVCACVSLANVEPGGLNAARHGVNTELAARELRVRVRE